MANEAEVSKSGKFFDTKAGKVVDSQPEEGVQLIAPGSEVTPYAEDTVKRYEAAVEASDDVETGADTDTAGRKATDQNTPHGGDPSKTVTTTQTSTSTRKGS